MSSSVGKQGGHAAGTRTLARVNREGLADPLAAVTHGLYLRGWFPCRKCVAREKCERYDAEGTCVFEQEFFEQRVRQLADLPHVDAEQDMPLITRAVIAEVRAARGLRWLGAMGEFDEGKLEEGSLAYHPAAVEVRRLQVEARSALAELGATPASRKRLEGTERDPVGTHFRQMIREAEAIEARQRAEKVQDAEFEQSDEAREGGR